MGKVKELLMDNNEREQDLLIAELDHENRLMRARNERLERELSEMKRKEALAEQPAQQEPVAYMGTDSDGNPNKFRLNPFSGCVSLYEKPSPVQKPVAYMDICEKNQMSGLRYWSEPDNRHEVPLYTSPPAQRTWVGLTDEERHACTQSPFTTENYRAIEAKLKQKNETKTI